MNYGTLIDNRLHPAPRAFMLHGAMVTNPKAEHFAAFNAVRAERWLPLYYPISDDPAPTPPDGKVVRFNGYAVVAGWIAPQYSFEDALLGGAADSLGKTRAEIDAFLEQIPQEGGV